MHTHGPFLMPDPDSSESDTEDCTKLQSFQFSALQSFDPGKATFTMKAEIGSWAAKYYIETWSNIIR